MIEITERQRLLYRYLLYRDEPVTLKRIASDTGLYDEYMSDRKFSWTHFHDTTCRREITGDITKLNKSGLRPIVHDSRGVMIANAEYTTVRLSRDIENTRRKLARLCRQYRDISNEPQVSIADIERMLRENECV